MEYFQLIKREKYLRLLRQMAMRENAAGMCYGQMPLLLYVAENDGCTQAKLARELHVSAASVAVSTERMEKAGLLEKSPDQSCKRSNCLHLTQKALTSLEQGKARMDAFDQKVFEGFSEEELVTLKGLYDRMIFNLTGENKEITHETFQEFRQKVKEKK